MKSITFILCIILLISSCKENSNDTIELIQDFDQIYLTKDQVTTPAQLVNDSYKNQFNDDFQKIVFSLDRSKILFPFKYRIYVNKEGKVERIKDLSPDLVDVTFNKFAENKEEVYTDFEKLTQKTIPIFSKWKFIPATGKDGNPALYREDFEGIFKLKKNGELELQLDLDSNYDLNSKKVDDSEFFSVVEEMPSPIGGVGTIEKKVAYPEIARRAGIQGRVFIKALIDEEGNVVHTELIKGIGAGCDTEAMRAIKDTKFKPGISNGKAVKVQVSIPILFKIQ